MEFISSRTLFACLAGLFSLVLGAFTLLQGPRERINRMYAAYMLTVAILLMPPTMLIEQWYGHGAALIFHRLTQFFLPLSSYFLICFLQEFGGITQEKRAIVLRRTIEVALVVIAPFYFTSLITRDFFVRQQGADIIFVREAGPLSPLIVLIFLLMMTAAAATTISRLRSSSGVKKKQMWIVTAGLFLGFLSTFFYFLSFKVIDLPWLYNPLHMLMSFCFAYAIFKYQLFEFDLWMRRAAIYAGVYLAIVSLPFFLFFPFRHLVPVGQTSFWVTMTGLMLLYGLCFALAPLLTTYLRNKIEHKKMTELISHNQQLRELDKLKTELIHNITHEFKTPLQVVENAMEILMKDVQKGSLDPNKVGDYLLMVKNNAGLLGMFIQNLLEVSRIEQSKIDLKPRRADLNSVIQNAIGFVKPLADQKNLELRFSPNGPVRLNADVEKLQQVFCNLLSNAIKFTEQGHIAIDLAADDETVTVKVTDTGSGIDPKYLQSVFEKFFQVPGEQRLQKEGTGLGLAIAKGWVEAHGGSIRAESQGLGKGTTFIVEIPLQGIQA